MGNNDLITVVIPIYNVDKYLEKCVESVINQTYKNIEIILVDDGSTDESGKICDDYKEKDSRIEVIHKKNGGLSDARNFGIEQATGKYITFIDSDDIVEKDYIEYLYNLIKKYNSEISICAYSILMESGKKIDNGKGYCEEKLTKLEALDRMLNEKGYSVSACAKLYDVELFKNVRYPIGKLCEDNGTTYKLFDKADTIAYGNESKYYYFKRKGSIMLSSFNEKKFDMIELTDEMCDYIDSKYPELKDTTERRRLYSRFNVLRQMVCSKKLDDNLIKKENEIIEWIKVRKKEILKNPKSSKRDKIAIICLCIGKGFFKIVWNFYEKIKY